MTIGGRFVMDAVGQRSMRSSLTATAMLGGSSLVSLALGLVSAKVSAVFLGPRGVGYLGLLQSTIGLATLAASFGIYGLVRDVSRARANNEIRREAALRRSGWILCWAVGGSIAALMIAARVPLARLALGGAEHAPAVPFLGGAVLLTMAAGVNAAFLNAHQRVREIARFGISNSVLGALIMVPSIAIWRERALAWALLVSALASAIVAMSLARRRAPAHGVDVTASDVRASAGNLMSFGIPYTASAVVGTGVQLSLPVFVLHVLGADHVGFYRAATGIAITYLGFLVAALGQDYYPRVSAAGDQPTVLVRLINEQYRLVLLIAGPLILAMLALAPTLVPLMYSGQFSPTVALLEWQLLGDVFKFAAFTMSFAILAQRGSLAYFFLELVSGGSLLLFSWLGMHRVGLEGLGVAFLLSAAISYVWSWTVLRRGIALRLTRQNWQLFVALVLGVFVIRVLPYLGIEQARTPVGLMLAAAAGLNTLYVFWGEIGGLKTTPAGERGVS